ncbi:MAG: polysaccharide biosynthesis protein [Sulfurovum sp.]|nr:polysaccharide biosynthesis protein [Sulfurovum sp.]
MKPLLRPTASKRKAFFIISDFILSLATFFLAYNLRFNFSIPEVFWHSFWPAFGILVSLKILFFLLLKNYQIVWRFFGLFDVKNLLKAQILAYLFFTIILFIFREEFNPFPRSVIIIDFFLSLIFLGGLRISKRFMSEKDRHENVKPTLIIGVNSKTGTIIQSALKGEVDYYPVAILSLNKDETTTNAYINNVRIYTMETLESLVKEKEITSVIITEKLDTSTLKTLVDRVNKIGLTEIKQVKLLGDKDEKLEDLSIGDLLARHPKDLDKEVIENFVKGKKVLITGAGGSIGSEISLQCTLFGASSLTLVDHGEYNLYQIGEQIPEANLKLLNITNKLLLEDIFEKEKPDIVIHAAAYKHVPVCEENQESAVYNNVLGSKIVIDMSIQYGVKKVVIISTDKAVRPTNVMGATKRVTELYAQNVQSEKTEIVAVRFGNVLGSSGSVIPKFKQQIEKGGPVTVTDPEITRYFMLIPEACQLVLQTAAIAKGGDLFILDMGEPIKIVDLAKQMIRLYGKEGEIDIVFTGLRKGEKLYEELLLDESDKKTKYSSIFIAKPTLYDITQLNHDINVLLDAKNKVGALQKIVPEFTREDLV